VCKLGEVEDGAAAAGKEGIASPDAVIRGPSP
jgi:hypothetical protein